MTISKESISVHVEDKSHDYMYNSRNPIVRYFHNEKIRQIIRLIGNTSKKKVLDVGCGDGFLLEKLGGKLFGVDVSSFRVKNAIKRLGSRAIILKANAKRLPFKDNFFDVVICSQVLEHIPNPQLVAREILRVTRKGGVIIITVPNETVMRFGRLCMLKFPVKIPDHVNSFKVRDITEMFGLKPERIEFIPSLVETLSLFKLIKFRKK